MGYDLAYQREILHVRPSFFYNLFNNFVSVGASFQFAQDFGNKMYEDSPYLYLQVEPVIKVNFGPGAYAALAYHYTNMYDTKSTDWITQVHWINLRVVYTF